MVLLLAQCITAGPLANPDLKAVAFFDGASTVTLVRHHWARLARLSDQPYTIWLRVVGKETYEEINTRLYTLALVTTQGELKVIKAVGMDSLSHIAEAKSLASTIGDFPEVVLSDVERPHGEADLLIGLDNVSLHPETVVKRANLKLYQCQFGTEWAIAGLIPGVNENKLQNFHILTRRTQLPLRAKVHNTMDKLPGFFEAEDLAYVPRRECRNCQSCQYCKLSAETLTKAQRELISWI